MDEEEKYLTVGIDSSFVDSGCSTSSGYFLKCELITVQLAAYLAALSAPEGYKLRLKIYSNQDDPLDNDIYKDLANGTLDIYPFEIAMNESHISTYGYHWTTAISSTGYVMYSRGMAQAMDEPPFAFLISPFGSGVWACAAIAAITSFFLAPLISGVRICGSYSKNVFLIVEFACAFLGALYSSRLKALVASPTATIPFQNLYDLAKNIEEGEKKIIIEDTQTLRWGILTRRDMARTPPVQALYNAAHKRGVKNAIYYEPNFTRICELLENSMEYVYFGYEEQFWAYCGHMCVWRYEMKEYPETPVTVPVAKRSPAAKVVDIVVHAMANYREVLIRRRRGGPCVMERPTNEFIGLKSIIGVTMVFAIGAAAGLMALFSELMLARRRKWSSDESSVEILVSSQV